MIKFSNISKSFGDRVLFENVTFTMGRGERLALIGRNGTGKSTIFKLITGEEHPDDGDMTIPRDYRCGHLPQHLHFEEENIVKEVCLGLPVDERDLEYKAEILLSGLGFSEQDMTLPASHFSGGFQIRVNLARLLVSEPDLLLLDEPTNYLDIVSVRWLTRFLQDWKSELMVISHDRDFLDEVSTHTMLIHRNGIRKIPGGTSKLYEDVATQEEVYEKTRINEEKKRRDAEVFINRFRAKASKAKAVQSRIKALDKMGTKEELSEEEVLDFEFSETAPFHGRSLLEATDVTFRYPTSPNGDAGPILIKDLTFTIGVNDRIGVIGKNGKGKSTLLKILAAELAPIKGDVKPSLNARIGYFGQTNISRLNPKHTIEEEITEVNPQLSRTRIRGICGTMMFSGDDALKKISVLSGGEKSRVLLGRILASPTNILFLDEPTNHLDMESIEALVESSKTYSGAIVIVTHSESILRELATRLIVFQGEEPVLIEGGYDYFLDKYGWEDEGGSNPSKASKPASPSVTTDLKPKVVLDKQERAKIVQEKSKVLTPLKQEVDKIENRICTLEKDIGRNNDELLTASGSGDGKRIAELSRAVAFAKREIDELFTQLEQVSSSYESKKREYADKLGED